MIPAPSPRDPRALLIAQITDNHVGFAPDEKPEE